MKFVIRVPRETELNIDTSGGSISVEEIDRGVRLDTSGGSITVEEVRQGWERAIPAGRLARPHEIADCITFLASERAGYLTGASILVDGGLVKALV